MSYTSAPSQPDFARYYVAGLIASALSFLGILVLVAISMTAGPSDLGTVLGVILWGALIMLIPAVFIALIISAPLGAAIALALDKVMEPSAWHGAITGATTAFVLLSILTVFDPSGLNAPDMGTALFVIGVLSVGAGSGWVAQHIYLGWPPPSDEAEIEVFD
ncbi:MAG: hypothetical protein AAF127_06855 [Pseudomonadota bacterium]